MQTNSFMPISMQFRKKIRRSRKLIFREKRNIYFDVLWRPECEKNVTNHPVCCKQTKETR